MTVSISLTPIHRTELWNTSGLLPVPTTWCFCQLRSATHKLLHFDLWEWYFSGLFLFCATWAVTFLHSHLHRDIYTIGLFLKRALGRSTDSCGLEQISQNHICLHHQHPHLHRGSPARAALPSGSAASSSGCMSAPPPSNLKQATETSQSVRGDTVISTTSSRILSFPRQTDAVAYWFMEI